MTEFTEQTFGPGVIVELDGNVYTRCVFDRCRMRFSGGPLPTFNGSKIKNVIWHWGGPAANALAFLSALHNHFGAPGRRDAEEMIRNIKSGKPRSE
jgi:hypothetical protein